MYRLVVLVVIAAGLVACSPSEGDIQTAIALTEEARPTDTPAPTSTPAPTATPLPEPSETPVSPAFISQLTKHLEDASRVDGAIHTDGTYIDLRRLLGDARGSFELTKSLWPADLPKRPLENLENALIGWDLALTLWRLDIDEEDHPVEPDINGFQSFVAYAGDELIVPTYPITSSVLRYRERKYIPIAENIPILIDLATNYFKEGKVEAIRLIE